MKKYKSTINSYRIVKDKENLPKVKISCSNDIAKYVRDNLITDRMEVREEIWVLMLNNANNITGVHRLGSGGITGVVVDQRLLFKVALDCLATSIALVHNHPSGNRKPSYADRDIAKKILKSGKILDIKLLDFLVITTDDHYSFMDEGEF